MALCCCLFNHPDIVRTRKCSAEGMAKGTRNRPRSFQGSSLELAYRASHSTDSIGGVLAHYEGLCGSLIRADETAARTTGRVVSRTRIGGLLNHYYRQPA